MKTSRFLGVGALLVLAAGVPSVEARAQARERPTTPEARPTTGRAQATPPAPRTPPQRQTAQTTRRAQQSRAEATAPGATSIRRDTARQPELGPIEVRHRLVAPPQAIGGGPAVMEERMPGGAQAEVMRIGPADVEPLMFEHETRLRRCYDAARQRNRNLAGDVSVRFTITSTGAVENVRVEGMPEAAACMSAEMRQVRFPPPTSSEIQHTHRMNLAPR